MWSWVVTILLGTGGVVIMTSKYMFARQKDAHAHLLDSQDGIQAYIDQHEAEGITNAELVFTKNKEQTFMN